MQKLTRSDLLSLEEYDQQRPDIRAVAITHKGKRRLALGDHAALYFEDRLTIRYQVLEMLRIEKIFQTEGIAAELEVYNPLIPDGHNWKATFMIEYSDVEQRRSALQRLIGIETALWMKVEGYAKVHPVANEDLDRTTTDKTSAVHFLRFELTPEMVKAAISGSTVSAGCDHPHYRQEVRCTPEQSAILAADLQM
ncbi:MAG: DUF3501 family protein [Gammaproteobacteria bacterium]|nr:DUF3501 family protein [Gammaproteobacteria bacterium]